MVKLRRAILVITLSFVIATGLHLLTAQEVPQRGSRATPKQIRDHLANHSMLTMTTVHSVVRSIRELRTLADDLNDAGQRKESTRLTKIIDEIIQHAESELAAKTALVATLNGEIDELKKTISD